MLLAASAIWLYWTVVGATNFQREVRLAQGARSVAFRELSDEESGLRGFVATGRVEFLEPRADSQIVLDEAFAHLMDRLDELGVSRLHPIVNDEREVHRLWHQHVAIPLLADRSRRDALNIQFLGKRMYDRIRKDDKFLDDGILGAANQADRAVTTAVVRIAIVTSVFGLAFIFAYRAFRRQHAKMFTEARRQQLLYENEKRIADALQEAFTQKALPKIPNLGFHASYMPASSEARVGGDWYDAFVLPDGRILFSIGDVAGHGVEAAVVMSRARQAIITSALHENNPAVVLQKANETLLLQAPIMVTAICGYIDAASLEITYATAGHPPPIMAHRGSDPYFLEHDGIPLGIQSSESYRSFIAHAREGTMLLLYTDGVLEHKRDLLEGENRLLEAAKSALADADGDLAASIREMVFADALPSDDVAIMTVLFSKHGVDNVTTLDGSMVNRITIDDFMRDDKAASP
ncbi:MAG: hypothetical protein NVS2B17_05140 [Candidatus Velthaea sp.]